MPDFKPCKIFESAHDLTSYEAATSERPDNAPQSGSSRKNAASVNTPNIGSLVEH